MGTTSSTNDDSTMTSSSYRIITTSFNPDENQPWSPAQEDTTPYMEVDFDEPTEITGVTTQGRVVSYTVQYQQGQDDVWQTMTVKRADPVTGELNDTPVVFEGSNNDMEIVKTRIMTVFVVSKIRVYPTASSDVTMRLELYGCGKGPVSTTTTPKYEVETTTQVVTKTTQPTDVTTAATIETTTVEVVKTTPLAPVTTPQPEDETTTTPAPVPTTTVVQTTTTVVQSSTPVAVTTPAPLDCDVIMGLMMGATNVVDEPTYDASSSDLDSSPADGHLDE